MSQQLIRAALETRLKIWADARPIAVAWENAAFTSPAEAYLRANLLPNETAMSDLQGRHRGYLGLWQVTVLLPLNIGSALAQTLAAELDALHSTETPLVTSGLRIHITRPMSPGPARVDDDRYVVPITCEYRANVIA